MAWIIKFDGVNDLMSHSGLSLSGDFRILIDDFAYGIVEPGSGIGTITGLNDAYDNFLACQRPSTGNWNLRIEDVNTYFPIADVPVTTDRGTYELERVGSTATLTVNGSSDSQSCGSDPFLLSQFGVINKQNSPSSHYGNISFSRFRIYDSTDTLIHDWDAGASSHAAGTPVLVDTVGSKDATGEGMPTDGSAWEELTSGITLEPTGIPTEEAFGSPLLVSAQVLSATGIESEEDFGVAEIVSSKVVSPSGIESGEAIGDPIVLTSLFIYHESIDSAEIFGNALVLSGAISISVYSINSDEQFGDASVLGSTLVGPLSISSSEEFGLPELVSAKEIFVFSIDSSEAFGIPKLTDGTVDIQTGYGIIRPMVSSIIKPIISKTSGEL